jgi:hypothetical protein
MVDDVPQYRTNTVRTIRGLEAPAIAKHQADGWELVSQVPATMLRTELNFRKLKPKPCWHRLPAPVNGLIARVAANPRSKWVAGAAVFALLAAIITIGAITENSRPEIAAIEPTASSPAPVKSTATPTPTLTAAASAVSDEEVVAAFQDFVKERAAAGVILAQTVSSITYVDRVVLVTFDPAAAGIDQATFDFVLEGWENVAYFVASPVAFSDEVGDRMRPAIDSIVTVAADGTPLGTYSAAQILELNGLSK